MTQALTLDAVTAKSRARPVAAPRDIFERAPWVTENATSYPAPGQILLPYGACQFASKVGVLAGNHFLTIIDKLDDLVTLGKLVLWQGAQNIVFSAAGS